MNHLWLGMSLEEAVATPIVFVSSRNDVNFEPGFDKVKRLLSLTNFSNHVKRLWQRPQDITDLSSVVKPEVGRISGTNSSVCFLQPQAVIDGLKALGHKVGDWSLFLNVVNAVGKESGCIAAVSDSRKKGQSAGYWPHRARGMWMNMPKLWQLNVSTYRRRLSDALISHTLVWMPLGQTQFWP